MVQSWDKKIASTLQTLTRKDFFFKFEKSSRCGGLTQARFDLAIKRFVKAIVKQMYQKDRLLQTVCHSQVSWLCSSMSRSLLLSLSFRLYSDVTSYAPIADSSFGFRVFVLKKSTSRFASSSARADATTSYFVQIHVFLNDYCL